MVESVRYGGKGYSGKGKLWWKASSREDIGQLET
jgi:hypothetical protein